MEERRPDAVRVEVAANVVEISDDDRDRLLQKLRIVGGFDSTIAKFEAVDSGKPIEFNRVEHFRLRAALEAWRNSSDLPAGIARLLAALEQGDPRRQSR